ncbi:MAG: co-chaperone GroES [Alphaproteobacteria bacterium]|nr:co-chaperone GroES [Alphaproteobacteria bacterium]
MTEYIYIPDIPAQMIEKQTVTPVKSQILFKPLKSPEVSESGLFIPENARAVNNVGKIVAVGKGTKEKPMKLKAGQIAHRVQGWGTEVLVNGELHFLMDEAAIIALEN